ncbi:hypothetical protein SAMN03159362_1692 [Pseudomonas sp. NFIX51]|uniref:hypothetical protein n=1 Tax=unclassified Pseudomonas TaxID=196821 RepID=UPI0008D4287E|nr:MULTISPECIES: hypothetical protein [unclassified Pseudomonas]SEK97303.1 hypothetical protein SAMN03159414_1817 [Pseudomonas sp. NFACC41-3]SMH41605.1 hypothetical protein SAMN03159362_1692 [Pseudomonas sp. NFIX51]
MRQLTQQEMTVVSGGGFSISGGISGNTGTGNNSVNVGISIGRNGTGKGNGGTGIGVNIGGKQSSAR